MASASKEVRVEPLPGLVLWVSAEPVDAVDGPIIYLCPYPGEAYSGYIYVNRMLIDNAAEVLETITRWQVLYKWGPVYYAHQYSTRNELHSCNLLPLDERKKLLHLPAKSRI